jgi:hypothetical protein
MTHIPRTGCDCAAAREAKWLVARARVRPLPDDKLYERRPGVWINIYEGSQRVPLSKRAKHRSRELAERAVALWHHPVYRIRVRLK